jgi:5-methylcytosine-specific restriction endonuclease McrA
VNSQQTIQHSITRRFLKKCLYCSKDISTSLISISFCNEECRDRWQIRIKSSRRAKQTPIVVPKNRKPRERRRDWKGRKARRTAKMKALESEVKILRSSLSAVQKKRLPLSTRPPGFYESREWRELRYTVIKRHGRKCQACGAIDKRIHVDHIKPRSKYPDLALEESNLQILCEDCNMGKSNKDETDWRPKND